MYRRLLSGFAFALVLAACSGEVPHDAAFDPNSPTDKQAKGTVAVVVQLEGESDHAGVDLQLQDDERTYTFTTQADGTATLTGVVPGKYTLTASTRYFVPTTSAVEVSLGSAVAVQGLTLQARRTSLSGTALQERMVNAQAEQSGGVLVSLVRTGSVRDGESNDAPAFRTYAKAVSRPVATTVSGADGSYTFGDVPAGTYTITVESNGATISLTPFKVTGEGAAKAAKVVVPRVGGFFHAFGVTPKNANDTAFTQQQEVRLELTPFHATRAAIGVVSGSDASQCDPGAPKPLVPATQVNLAGQGDNIICVAFHGQDNEPPFVQTKKMHWDATAPIFANAAPASGKSNLAAASVTLLLQAVDNGSGVATMRLSENANFAGAAELPFSAAYAFPISTAGDGAKTVYVRFYDRAGNSLDSSPVNLVLDTAGPVVSAAQLRRIDGTAITSGAYVNRPQVLLTSTVADDTALEMQVATNGSTAGVPWETYRNSFVIDLPAPTTALPRLVTIDVRVRDALMHEQVLFSGTVNVDVMAPTGSIAINMGAAVTNTTSVNLELSAAGASEMRLSNDGNFDTENWEDYNPAKTAWPLAGAGLQTVHVRYRDEAGNESSTYFANIVVDQAKPTGTLRINNGAAWSNDLEGDVTLSISAADDRTGVEKLRVANKTSTCAADLAAVSDEGFVTVKAWVLDNPTGGFGLERTVCAAFGDGAGNWSDPLEAEIGFDPEAPKVFAGGLSLDGGAAFARSNQVAIALTATGATEMQLANDAAFTGAQWEPFRFDTVWFLESGEGDRPVWVRFRDAAGNTTGSYSRSIEVDSTAPSSASVQINGGAAYTNDADVTLTLAAVDANFIQVTDDGFFDTEPVTGYLASVPWTLGGADGAKVVAVRFLDEAGNAVVASAAIVLDTQPFGPSLTVQLTGTDVPAVTGRTKNQVVNAVFSGLTAEAVEMQLSNDADFIGAPWQPTAATSSFTLLPGEGLKSVYVRVRNAAGNTSHLMSATIVLDQTGPAAPGLAVSDVDGDGYGIEAHRVELRWTHPADAVRYEVERYILGADLVFTPITTTTSAVDSYKDYVTASTGFVHQYRVRGVDDLGNVSPWSMIAVAYPFEPVQGVYWVKTDVGYRYQFPVNRGTFSLRPALHYTDANGQGSLALAEKVTNWLADLDPTWYNTELVVKTSNQDNSLVYNSYVPVFGNEYTILEAANVGNENEVGLAVDANGATHMLYGGQYFTIHYATNASGKWVIESLGTANMYEPEMVVDKDGHLHAVFTDYMGGNWTIVYMTNAGGFWSRVNLAQGGAWSYYQPTIAVAADGTVHIAYSANFSSLLYGTNPLGAWSPTAIDSSLITGASLGIDGAGTVHIVSQGSGQTLRYGYNSGSGWTFATIDTGADSGNLVIDAQGNIHTVYRSNTANAVRYAVLSNGSWSFETLADSAWSPSLTLDPSGEPRVSYAAGTNMRLATKSGTWSYQTLESSPNGYRPPTLRSSARGDLLVGYIDLTIHSVKYRKFASSSSSLSRVGAAGDGGNYPVLLTSGTGGLRAFYAAGGLAYGANVTGTWSKQMLDSGIAVERIATATHGGNTYVAYREGTNIRYVNDVGGTWQSPVVLSTYGDALAGAGNGGVGIAVDSNGQSHVVFARFGGGYAGVGYLTNPGGVWSALQNYYDSNAGYPKEVSVKMGPDGKVRIALTGWTSDKYSLRYAVIDPAAPWWASFSAVNVDTGNADEVALVVDAQGKNHIVYIGAFTAYSTTEDVQSGVLRYATDKSGTWVTTTIDGAGAYKHPRVAIDANGFLHVTYNDSAANYRLKYATNLAGSWRSVNLDPAGTLGPSGLVADPEGGLGLAFRRAGENTVLLLENFMGYIPAASISRSTAF